ncbi:MAG: HAMP domain-containing protein [Bdellovibrionaceae bacterium]|nr:HAMP domain-containing protein [Pseudobdellovibrionaceae bacterium]
MAAQLKQGQVPFVDEATKEAYTGAYAKTALGVTAVAMVPTEVILEAANAVKRESFYIAGRILSVALFAIFVFSITLTTPIENLAELTNRVAKGDFSAKANIGSRDEVGQLGGSFQPHA